MHCQLSPSHFWLQCYPHQCPSHLRHRLLKLSPPWYSTQAFFWNFWNYSESLPEPHLGSLPSFYNFNGYMSNYCSGKMRSALLQLHPLVLILLHAPHYSSCPFIIFGVSLSMQSLVFVTLLDKPFVVSTLSLLYLDLNLNSSNLSIPYGQVFTYTYFWYVAIMI